METLPQLKDNTCVIMRGGEVVFESGERGIKPLVSLIDGGVDVSGCVACDKIVGRAAALLYVYMGVGEVRAEVMSEGARAVLCAHGIPCSAIVVAEGIINRKGDGPCPMERAVDGIDDPASALGAVRQTLKMLSKGRSL